MKRIFLLILVLVFGKISFSQNSYKFINFRNFTSVGIGWHPPVGTTYPVTQYLGSTNTMVVSRGGLMAGQTFVLPSYVDTSSANNANSYTSGYVGSMIWSTTDSSAYILQKSSYGTYWVKFAGSGGGATGSFWNLTGNYMVNIPAFFGIGTNSNDALPIKTTNVTRLTVPADGILNSTASTDSVLVKKANKDIGVIAKSALVTTPTWQQTLTAGSTLTGANTIAGGSFAWTHNSGSYTINAQGGILINATVGDNINIQSDAIYLGLNADNQDHLFINETGMYFEDGLTEVGFRRYMDLSGNDGTFKINLGAAAGDRLLINAFNREYAMGEIDGTNGGSRFFLSDGGFAYYDNIAHNGNFGINKSVPSVALDVVGAVKGTSTATFGAAAGTTGKINLIGTTSGTVGITTAAAAGTWDMTLPTDDGNNLQFLQTNGSGVTSWQTPSTVATAVPINGLTASTGTNSITVSDAQTWNFNSLASSNTGLSLISNTTGSTTAPTLFYSRMLGANAASGVTTTTGSFINNHTGATSTNNALSVSASGGTVNNALDISAGALTLNSSAGTSGQVLTSAGANTLPTWTTPSTVATAVPLSGVTAMTVGAGINNAAFGLNWAWNSIANDGFEISSSSTAAAGNAQRLLIVNLNGTNATSTQTTIATSILNAHAGTASTNIGLQVGATTGTVNNALNILAGALTLNSSAGTTGQVLTSAGANTLPTWTTPTTGTVTGTGTTNTVPKFTSSTAIGNSIITDDGTKVGISTASITPATLLDVDGIITSRTAFADVPASATEGLRFTYSTYGATYANSIFNEVSATPNTGLMQFRVNNGASTQATVMSLIGDGSVTIPTSASILTVGGGATASKLKFMEPSGSGTNYSEFQAVAQAGNITYSLPPTAVAGGVWTDVAGNGVLTSVAPTTTTSGTYTPTLSNTTNVTSSTPIICHYTRVGNEITVTGSAGVVTTLAVSTVLSISLPVASNFAAITDASGVGQASSAIATNAYVQGNATSDLAELTFIGLSIGGSGTIYFSFTYTVI